MSQTFQVDMPKATAWYEKFQAEVKENKQQFSTEFVQVIGAGLAGCECAWQLAQAGISVHLYEMKPEKKSPAHHTDLFGELVCSNSLRANNVENAVGLLKEELRIGGSLMIETADKTAVPAGGALAVDREAFSQMITEKVKNHPNITVFYEEVAKIPTGGHYTVIATGPLTADALAEDIGALTCGLVGVTGTDGEALLNFYDAAAPIVSFDSIDMDSAYFASRYDKGTPDYINCPMSKEEYTAFWSELVKAEEAEVHGFEDKKVFEGCKPIEVEARRGEETLLYGCLKPVGLKDPKTGRDPYAVVQLRKDNNSGTMYNLVGFQTHLKFPEQQRVFSMIPALKQAEFLRFGVMHRNTYLNSPKLLNAQGQVAPPVSEDSPSHLFFAGQVTGVEGYVESIASGWYVGRQLVQRLQEEKPLDLSKDTAMGALMAYVSDVSVADFQPMKMNFGIVSSLGYRVKGGKRAKNELIAQRALEEFRKSLGLFSNMESSDSEKEETE